MGAQLPKERRRPYTKVGFDDEEDHASLLPLQIIDSDPVELTPPCEIVKSIPLTSTARSRQAKIKAEILSCLECFSTQRLFLMHVSYESSAVFDDLIGGIEAKNLSASGVIPIVIIDPNITEKKMKLMRASCIRALEKNVAIAMHLTTVIGVTYFSDLACLGVLTSESFIPVASCTNLPIVCSCHGWVSKIQKPKFFLGVAGGGQIVELHTKGNRNVFDMEYTAHNRLINVSGSSHSWLASPLLTLQDLYHSLQPNYQHKQFPNTHTPAFEWK